MIYAVEKENKIANNLESVIYKDQSGLSWHVQRTEAGLYVSYLGPKDLMPKYFECKVNGRYIYLKNTNLILFQATDLDSYCHIRTIIKDGFIDQIWDVFTSLFVSRLKINPTILQTEMSA